MMSGESRDGGALRLGEQVGDARWAAAFVRDFLLALCWRVARLVPNPGRCAAVPPMDEAHGLSEKALAVHTWRTYAAERAVHLQGAAATRWFEATVGRSGGRLAPVPAAQFVYEDHWRLDEAIHEWMSDQHTTIAFTVPPSCGAGPRSPQAGDRVLHELYESLQREQTRGSQTRSSSREPSLGPNLGSLSPAVRAALMEEGASRFSPLPQPTGLGPSCPVTPSAHQRMPPPSLPLRAPPLWSGSTLPLPSAHSAQLRLQEQMQEQMQEQGQQRSEEVHEELQPQS